MATTILYSLDLFDEVDTTCIFFFFASFFVHFYLSKAKCPSSGSVWSLGGINHGQELKNGPEMENGWSNF